MPFDASPTVETEVMLGALALLGPNGENWIKRAYTDGKGGYCIVGAVRASCRGTGWSGGEELLRRVTARSPGHWNDAGERTFDDVRGALLEAAGR